jgi:hypothetical protein
MGEGEPEAEMEWMERAGEGASRLMTGGLMLELLVSDVWLRPGVMVTGVHEPKGLMSSSSSELSKVRSMTSAFLLLPGTPPHHHNACYNHITMPATNTSP